MVSKIKWEKGLKRWDTAKTIAVKTSRSKCLSQGAEIGVLDRILKGGEERAIRDNIGIIKTAIEANRELQKLIKSDSKKIDRIRELEKESDSKAFTLSSAMSAGAVSPNVLDDMLTLVDMEDNIVDSIYNLSRELVRYKIPNRRTDKMVKEKVLTMLGMADSALGEMQKMLSSDDTDKIQQFRKKIEVLEELTDDIKDSMLDYEYKNDMDYKTFLHISEVAHKADNILDACEDSADMFLSVMLSIMT